MGFRRRKRRRERGGDLTSIDTLSRGGAGPERDTVASTYNNPGLVNMDTGSTVKVSGRTVLRLATVWAAAPTNHTNHCVHNAYAESLPPKERGAPAFLPSREQDAVALRSSNLSALPPPLAAFAASQIPPGPLESALSAQSALPPNHHRPGWPARIYRPGRQEERGDTAPVSYLGYESGLFFHGSFFLLHRFLSHVLVSQPPSMITYPILSI